MEVSWGKQAPSREQEGWALKRDPSLLLVLLDGSWARAFQSRERQDKGQLEGPHKIGTQEMQQPGVSGRVGGRHQPRPVCTRTPHYGCAPVQAERGLCTEVGHPGLGLMGEW